MWMLPSPAMYLSDELTASASFELIFGLLSKLVCVERSSGVEHVAGTALHAQAAGAAFVLDTHRAPANLAPHHALFLVRRLNPPKWAFFLGCTRWIVLIASLAKPCVRRIERRSARGLHTFIRRCRRIPGTTALRPPRRAIAAPAPAPITPIAPAAPAADRTGCLMTAPTARLTMGEARATFMSPPPVGIMSSAPLAIGPTPGMNPTAFLARPPRKEKNPGSPR